MNTNKNLQEKRPMLYSRKEYIKWNQWNEIAKRNEQNATCKARNVTCNYIDTTLYTLKISLLKLKLEPMKIMTFYYIMFSLIAFWNYANCVYA